MYATTNVEDDYTTQHVSIDTPLFLFDVDIPPTFSQRMDVWVGLHQSPAVLEGQCTGVIGETVRAEHPLGARDMEEVRQRFGSKVDFGGCTQTGRHVGAVI